MNDFKPNKKASNIWKGLGVILLSGCLIASLSLNIYQAIASNSQNQKVNKFIKNQLERQAKEEEQENTYQEDGYVIGGEYEIRSTTAISDAYKNNDTSKLSDEEAKTLKLAKKVVKKVIKDGMSNYEKELAIYRWMYKNIGQGSGSTIALPNEGNSVFTPYGVLTSHNAVCVGYATTFRLFMNMLDMDCHIVHNDYHSWDMVQLDDGEWYQTDIYSDVSEQTEYRNFNMTDNIARTSHEWDESSLPEAKGIKYSYAVQSSKEISDIYAVPAKIKKAIEKKKGSLYFKFKKKLSDDDLQIADYLVSQVNTALTMTPELQNYNLSGNWYEDEDKSYILGLFLVNYEYSGEEGSFDANSKEGKKIVEIINSVFGVDTSQFSEGYYDDTMSYSEEEGMGETITEVDSSVEE